MAAVWEGHDEILARAVAVKILHPHLAGDQSFLERFKYEAVSAARLSHPNVVATYDAGMAGNGTAFIVMELVRGETLRQCLIDRGPMPPRMAAGIGGQIADALAHAHAAGLVHRDIKPGNVLLDRREGGDLPRVKVTDFGIAKAAEGLGMDLTRTGTVLGTPRYLSPEQIEGYEPDARADLYALGVVLFEMLTGQPPFVGPTDMSTAVQHLNVTPPDVRSLRPDTPAALSDTVRDLLAKRPADRPQSAVAVRRALAGIESGAGADAIFGAVGTDATAGVATTVEPARRRGHGPKRRPGHHLPDQCHLDPSPAAPGPELGHDEWIDQRADHHSCPRGRPGSTHLPGPDPAPGQLAGTDRGPAGGGGDRGGRGGRVGRRRIGGPPERSEDAGSGSRRRPVSHRRRVGLSSGARRRQRGPDQKRLRRQPQHGLEHRPVLRSPFCRSPPRPRPGHQPERKPQAASAQGALADAGVERGGLRIHHRSQPALAGAHGARCSTPNSPLPATPPSTSVGRTGRRCCCG